MVSTDENALICDFAETYRIYNYRQLPARLAAVYACGLRQNSRIMMKLSGAKVPLDTLLFALIADAEKINLWMQTRDAVKGKNKPQSILEAILDEKSEKPEKPMVFESPEAFVEWRTMMMGG